MKQYSEYLLIDRPTEHRRKNSFIYFKRKIEKEKREKERERKKERKRERERERTNTVRYIVILSINKHFNIFKITLILLVGCWGKNGHQVEK